MHRSTSTITQNLCRRLAWWSLFLIGLIPASIVFMMLVGIVGNAFNLLERADDYITDQNRYLPYVVVGVGERHASNVVTFSRNSKSLGYPSILEFTETTK